MLYGLDIGGTKIELAVFNNQLERLYSQRINTPHDDYSEWLQSIVTLVETADARFNIKGTVGLGIPGAIDHETGIANIVNIPAANQRRILKDLSLRLKREVRAENDANCFALSEAWDNENQGYPFVLGLILGTGFGGGMVFNGKIYSGRSGMAGELGHIQLNYHALKLLGWDNAPIYQCRCNNTACLDTYLSGRGFELLYDHFAGEFLSAQQIIKNFYAGNKKAIEFVNIFVHVLATSVANIITAVDPHLVVLGGGLSNFDYLYEILPNILPQYLMQGAKIPTIKKAKYGDSSGVRGAAALFLT